MAKTACYIIDSVGVTGITDFQGAEVVDPQNNQVWECEDDNLDIATWKLYCPQLLDPPKPLDAELIDKAILDYVPAPIDFNNWTVQQIKDYLDGLEITYPAGALKAELVLIAESTL